jgi:hypothetical protein
MNNDRGPPAPLTAAYETWWHMPFKELGSWGAGELVPGGCATCLNTHADSGVSVSGSYMLSSHCHASLAFNDIHGRS